MHMNVRERLRGAVSDLGHIWCGELRLGGPLMLRIGAK
jgi:hypothetical protein